MKFQHTKRNLFVLIAIFGLALILPGNAAAKISGSYGEHIEKFDSEISVQSDGSVLVTERILYDFTSYDRHGIIRYIPLHYSPQNDNNTSTSFGGSALGINEVTPKITVRSVTDENGVPYQFKETRYSYLSLRVGDPDLTISGERWYVITYEIDGVVAKHSGYDELFWNVTGNGWNVPINKATATISIPEGSSFEENYSLCYTGSSRSKQQLCEAIVVDGQTFTYSATNLLSYEGLTISAAFASDLLPEKSLFRPARITNYDVQATVEQDTAIHVVETIDIDFGQYKPKELERELLNVFGRNDSYTLPIKLHSVTDSAGNELRARDFDDLYHHPIYIPAASGKTFSGTDQITIDYTVEATGWQVGSSNQDSVYWNVTGISWPMPIEQVDVRLTIPEGSTLAQNSGECYIGYSLYANDHCTTELVNGTTFTYNASNLAAGDGLAVAANFARGTVVLPADISIFTTPDNGTKVTIGDWYDSSGLYANPLKLRVSPGTHSITASSPGYYDLTTSVTLESGDDKTVTLDLRMTPPNIFWTFIVPWVTIALSASLLLFFWWERGRDPKGRGTIIAEYEPPDQLSPGALGVIYNSKVNKLDITAEIIHLAVNGYIKIKKSGKNPHLSV